MKTLMLIAIVSGPTWAPAAEPATTPAPLPQPMPQALLPPQPVPQARNPQAPHAWLGLEVDKPSPTVTSQVPSLPPGMGFVVKSVDDNGPAKAAGLQASDLLWKLGDQMLVNEGQLAALLRMAKPSDEITLSGFRAGQPLEVKLKLGRAPLIKLPIAGDVDAVLLPGDCGGPMRVVNVAQRLATYTTDDGTVVVRLEGDVYQVKIAGPKDELIYQGDLPADGNLDQVPESWRRRVHALHRGLNHALEDRLTPTRQPRPRVVPPANPKP